MAQNEDHNSSEGLLSESQETWTGEAEFPTNITDKFAYSPPTVGLTRVLSDPPLRPKGEGPQALQIAGASVAFFLLGLAGYWAGDTVYQRLASRPESNIARVQASLETGSLEALAFGRAVVSSIEHEMKRLPPTLLGAKAEIHARMFHSFGHSPTMRQIADDALQSWGNRPFTLEAIAAKSYMATTTSSLSECLKQLASFSNSPKVYVLKAHLLERLGEPTRALEELYAAYDTDPTRRETLIALGRWHASRGQASTALTFFAEARRRWPHDIEIAIDFVVAGELSNDSEHTKESRRAALFELVTQSEPDSEPHELHRAQLILAVIRRLTDPAVDPRAFPSVAESAYADSPEFASAVAELYLALGEWSQAKKYLERQRAIDPFNDDARVRIAIANWAETRKPHGAEDARVGNRLPFGRVVLSPTALVRFRIELDGERLPIASFERLKRDHSGEALATLLEAQTSLELAKWARKNGDNKRALAWLLDAKAKRENTDILRELGLVQLTENDPRAAIASLEAAHRLDTKHPFTRSALAMAYLRAGQTKAARTLFESLDKDGYVLASNHIALAHIHLSEGKTEAARSLIEAAIRLDPSNGNAWVASANLAFADHDEARATAHCQTALQKNPAIIAELLKERPTWSPWCAYVFGRQRAEARSPDAPLLLLSASKHPGIPHDVHYYLGRAWIASPETRAAGRKELKVFLRSKKADPKKSDALRLLRQ